MNTKLAVGALGLHAGLLVAASTRFSVLSWIWGDYAWKWDYFQYSYKNGWGYHYESDYSLVIVAMYIAAYLAGVAGHSLACKHLLNGWNITGIILSLLGLASFLIEGSHWVFPHHLSWIVSCPAASLFLAGVVMFQCVRVAGKLAEQTAAPKAGSAAAPPA